MGDYSYIANDGSDLLEEEVPDEQVTPMDISSLDEDTCNECVALMESGIEQFTRDANAEGLTTCLRQMEQLRARLKQLRDQKI